jgi:hypothetical protein
VNLAALSATCVAWPACLPCDERGIRAPAARLDRRHVTVGRSGLEGPVRGVKCVSATAGSMLAYGLSAGFSRDTSDRNGHDVADTPLVRVRVFPYAGQPMHILAGHGGRPTGFAAMEITVPGRFAGPIPHAHDEFDEAIYVLSGGLLVIGEGELQEAGPAGSTPNRSRCASTNSTSAAASGRVPSRNRR